MANQEQAYAALSEIFSDVFMRDDIVVSPTLTAANVEGWDSFKQIEIIIAVEEKFNVKFHTRELDSMKSLGDLANLIVSKTA